MEKLFNNKNYYIPTVKLDCIDTLYSILIRGMRIYEYEINVVEKNQTEILFSCNKIPFTKKPILHYECFVLISKKINYYDISIKSNYKIYDVIYIFMFFVEIINIIFIIVEWYINGFFVYHYASVGIHILFFNLSFHAGYRNADKIQILKIFKENLKKIK
jgi:hypothetical protein